MRMLVLLALIVLCPGASVVRAEIVEIPLPALEGIYSETGTTLRSVSFDLERTPSDIKSVSIRLEGDATVAMVSCDAGDNSDTWPVDVTALLPGPTPSAGWRVNTLGPATSGPFAVQQDFVGDRPSHADWGFLLDGAGDVELRITPAYLSDSCTTTSISPMATVRVAVLTIDAEFTVPTEGTTWGGIKALYGNAD